MEQEAAVQQHKKRLVDDGKLSPALPGAVSAEASPSQQQGCSASFDASLSAYDVLPEVLQAQARVDDPHAALRKEFDLRIRGEPPPIPEAELRRHRGATSALGAAVGHVPRLSLSGRNRYSIPEGAFSGGGGEVALANASYRGLSPHATEVASRGYNAGMRAVVYGSLLAVAVIAVGGTAAVQALEIGGPEDDFRERARAWGAPAAAVVRAWVAPVKAAAEGWVGASGASGPSEPSELQTRLRGRYNPAAGGGRGVF